jgi:hypothetical protein
MCPIGIQNQMHDILIKQFYVRTAQSNIEMRDEGFVSNILWANV